MQIDRLSVVAHKIKFTLTMSALSTQLTALKLFVLTRIVPASFSSPFRAIRVDSNVVQHPVTTESPFVWTPTFAVMQFLRQVDPNDICWLGLACIIEQISLMDAFLFNAVSKA
jgi:hypothetical protein